MEINNRGLTFRKFDDSELIVEINGEESLDYFGESEKNENLMFYNFTQMQNFCQRHETGKHINGIKKFSYSFYIVVKNFSNEEIHLPGKEAEIYIIYQNTQQVFSYFLKVYANERNENSKGFVSIDFSSLIVLLKLYFTFQRDVACFISIIDNQGEDRFTQTVVFPPPQVSDDSENPQVSDDTENDSNEKSLFRFISRDTVLRHAFELLHYDDLVLYISLEMQELNDLDDSWHSLIDSDIKNIFSENSVEVKQPINSSQFETENRVIHITYEETETFKNAVKILMAGYLLISKYGDICDSYEVARKYNSVGAVEFCRAMFKKYVCVDNISLIHNLATKFDDEELEGIVECFRKDYKEYGKFFCNIFNIDFYGAEIEMDDLKSEHIHYVFDEHFECDSLVELKHQYYSFNFDEKNTEEDYNFSSFYSENEKGEFIFHSDTDFGKFLCMISNVFRDMSELCSRTQSQNVLIKKKIFEVFKTIYRLARGTSYIKASTIHDIIALYEASDFCNIPLLLDTCRKLFKRHICIRNVESIRELSVMCCGDVDLKNIVESFQRDYEKFINMMRNKKTRVIQYIGFNNSLEEVKRPEIQYNFYQ